MIRTDTTTKPRVRAVIVGATGYSGAEALSILLAHGGAEVVGLFGSGRSEGESPRLIGESFPRFAGVCDLPVLPASPPAILDLKPTAAFLATPVQASLDLAPPLLDAGVAVFDLSAAFRFADPGVFAHHYKAAHPRPDLCASAVYGLCEAHRQEIASADLVAVPGCYPTASILALRPLVRAGAIATSPRPIIDAVSGISGAGRNPSARTSFCEVSLQPYDVLKHRHQPEIDTYCGARTVFTPHVGPYDRGIVATIHATLARGWNGERIAELYDGVYGGEPFVHRLSQDAWPSAAGVRGTNMVHLKHAADESDGHLVVVSAIDNLVKGAAGQAVQCMNIRFGQPETRGLLPIGAGQECAR